MNVFQLSYFDRLRDWIELRKIVADLSLAEKCVEIDKWWQRAPLVNRYLHMHDIESWPDPWSLLYDNEYCLTARALGMAYTLTLIGIHDHKICEATDEYGDDYILVRCDKYLLNYHPGTVVNNILSKFTIKREVDISQLTKKIR